MMMMMKFADEDVKSEWKKKIFEKADDDDDDDDEIEAAEL